MLSIIYKICNCYFSLNCMLLEFDIMPLGLIDVDGLQGNFSLSLEDVSKTTYININIYIFWGTYIVLIMVLPFWFIQEVSP